MAHIIDGNALASALKARVKTRVDQMKVPPKLVVVLAGENPASLVYIRNKERACAETGIVSEVFRLPETVSQSELLDLIDRLNQDPDTHGILVQQPLPKHIDTFQVVSRIDPRKDVDCLHPYNVGLSLLGQGQLLPCTPAGVIEMLTETGVPLAGKRCVVIGRSDIVGKPLAFMLLAQHGTVTICHSRTENLSEICRTAEVLVAAVGKPHFVTADMISEGCAVIDVGVNRLADKNSKNGEKGKKGKKVCGDVDFEGCFEKASYITKVPGGVGPMTVAKLMENCMKAWEIQHAQ